MKVSSEMMNLYSEVIMRWNYKTEHFSLKKEGLLGSAFLDEAEIELSLNEFGKAGWELVSLMEVNDGVIAVFKQPFSNELSHQVVQKDDRVKEVVPAAAPEAQHETVPKPNPVTHADKGGEDVGDIKIF